MSPRRLLFVVPLASLLLPLPAFAQQSGMAHGMAHANATLILGSIEIPFLMVAVFYSLRTANALRGGVFGRGMGLMAGGLFIMAIGHMLMLADTAFGVDFLNYILGGIVGSAVWVLALVASWGLTGIGFHSIYRASRA